MINRWLLSTGLPVSRLRSEADRMFSDVFADLFGGRPLFDLRPRCWGRSFPAVNVWEDDEKLYAEAEVPGLKMEDLEILVKGDELTIEGERKGVEQEGVAYHRRERGTGSFCSVVQLPVDVDVDRVEANLENGVLTITMPKAESARPRKIEVKALSS
jgi:HSP20 family protein